MVPLLLLEWPEPLVLMSSSFLLFSHPATAAASDATSATDPIFLSMTETFPAYPTCGIDETQDVIPLL
jgi:hypothetical protein